MADVIKLHPSNRYETADEALESLKGKLDSVLVLGWDKDHFMLARADKSLVDGGEILWLIEKFKFNLMNGAYEQ